MPTKTADRSSLYSTVLMLVAFAADRLTKRWAEAYLAQHGPTRLNDLLTLRETYNRGIAFGMFQGIGRLVGWLTIVVLLGLYLYQRRLPATRRGQRVGIALIIGGAAGNLLDRVVAGQVLDFIQTPLRSGIFNVADLMIHLGLLLAIISTLLQREPQEASPASNQERLEPL